MRTRSNVKGTKDYVFWYTGHMQESGEIKILLEPISRAEAQDIGKHWYADLVKGVVDIERGLVALGGEYHMDANTVLIAHGSAQNTVWGFNVYPDQHDEEWIEFTSLINIRPAVGNRGMLVESEEIRAAMRTVIERFIV